VSVFPSILEVVNRVIATVVPIIQRMTSVIQRLMPIVQTVISAVVTVLSTAWDTISPIMDIAMSILEALMSVVEAVFPHIQSIITDVWGALEPIFKGIADGLSWVGNAISGVADKVGGFFGGGKKASSNAYGKDRVPYDNYPARLHQGEKVLTRNQADQYDRAMSTRGVQLSQNIADVPRANNSGVSSENSTGTVQGAPKSTTGETTVNIEKLADTVVIQKEADTDKVVADMINTFRKLVPNMT